MAAHLMSHLMLVSNQSDSEEYQTASKLWEVYLQTRNEFVQPGDGDEDDEEGDDMMANSGLSNEYEVGVCIQILLN